MLDINLHILKSVVDFGPVMGALPAMSFSSADVMIVLTDISEAGVLLYY